MGCSQSPSDGTSKNLEQEFIESEACTTRAACRHCRMSPAWRKLHAAPAECPYGVTVESAMAAVLPFPPRSPGLGDMIASVLNRLGITKERVSKAVGGDCGCKKRQEALNTIGRRIGIG